MSFAHNNIYLFRKTIHVLVIRNNQIYKFKIININLEFMIEKKNHRVAY